MRSEQSLNLTNGEKESIIVWLEPWGEDYQLNPSDHLIIGITSNISGVPELVYRTSALTVYVWSQCRCRVFLNGNEVTRSSNEVETP